MRSFYKFTAIAGIITLVFAALTSTAQAQSQAAVTARVVSATPLIQPNQNYPTAFNVVYEYAGRLYSVQLPNDPGAYVQLQVLPQTMYAPPPVMYHQPYYANSYVNPYLYPAIGIGLGYAAYRGGSLGHHGYAVRSGHGHH